MGREVRRVPPNWQHPTIERYGRTDLQPMYDQHISAAMAEWLKEFDRVRSGQLDEFEREYYTGDEPLAQWMQDGDPPPDPAYHRPWRDEEATWLQVWETVSEGTPVTPPFSTAAELVDYLVVHGDHWQQQRWARGDSFMQPGPPGYSREVAETFVGTGWAPSMVVIGTTIVTGIEVPHVMRDRQ